MEQNNGLIGRASGCLGSGRIQSGSHRGKQELRQFAVVITIKAENALFVAEAQKAKSSVCDDQLVSDGVNKNVSVGQSNRGCES